MDGQRWCKNENQKKVIDLLQQYWRDILGLNELVSIGQWKLVEQRMNCLQLSLIELQKFSEMDVDLFVCENVQTMLLKIKELQQQFCDYVLYKRCMLARKMPKKQVLMYFL